MQELYIDKHTCVDEAGNAHTFQYILLRDRASCDGFSGEDYGVMVRSSNAEQASVPHITPDRRRIEQLLALLCQQGVSPVHLRDVIEDWL